MCLAAYMTRCIQFLADETFEVYVQIIQLQAALQPTAEVTSTNNNY